MARRRPAFLTLGVAAGSVLALVCLGGVGPVDAESQEQGSAEEQMVVPEQHPLSSDTAGLFDDIAIPDGWSGGEQTVATLHVGNGDTLLAMLVGAGSDEPAAGRAVAAIADFFNPRRLQIGQIVTAIADVGQRSAAVSIAVDQQASTTAEITRNVQEASVGTREVAQSTGRVREAAADTDRAARDVSCAAGNLASQSSTLRDEVGRYLAEARSA